MAVLWAVSQLERQSSDDGVTIVYWNATDSEIVGDITHIGADVGSCVLTPDSSALEFIAFADITEDVVISWVKASLNAGPQTVAEIETAIAAQITLSKTPTTITGTPW
tara:strand:+ start:588 stop:911 length:324 start_codon:yes stop_codon:yes gene_type:complete